MLKIRAEHPGDLASRMFYLAYEASNVLGMGALRAQTDATEADVFHNVLTAGDYSGSKVPAAPARDILIADYVFGRCLKLSIRLVDGGLEMSEDHPHPEYQTWAQAYATNEALAEAAAKSLGVEVTFE